MSDEDKRNLQYFECSSMGGLFSLIQAWQIGNEQRFLSLSIEKDKDKFCCIALTNPTEVIIKGGIGVSGQAIVDSSGALRVRTT
jgi:hypothetical protein